MASSGSLEETISRYFDSIIKSRFDEIFGSYESFACLGDVCSLHARIGWQALKKEEHLDRGEYILITGKDFEEGLVNFESCKYVSKERYDMDVNIMVGDGDVLVTKDGTIGKIAVVKNPPMRATLNSGVFVIRCTDPRITNEFVSYCLRSFKFDSFIQSVKRGATIGHLNQSEFIKFKLPIPDKKDQDRFSEFVTCVSRIKDLYIQFSKKLDLVVKSRFVEMFGFMGIGAQDPSWPKLSEVGTVLSGATPRTDVEEYWGGDILWVTPAEISPDQKFVEYTGRTITEGGRDSCSLDFLPEGTVLLTSRAPIGKVAIAKRGMYCNQGFKNILCGESINNVYLYTVLANNTDFLNSLGRGATFKEISRRIVENIRIPLPSIELQNEFASFVEQVDKSRFMIIQRLNAILEKTQASTEGCKKNEGDVPQLR